MSGIEITFSVLRVECGKLVGLAIGSIGQSEAEFFAHRFFHHMKRGRTRINVDPLRGLVMLVHPREGKTVVRTTTAIAGEIHAFVRQKKLLRRATLTAKRGFGVSSALVEREYAGMQVHEFPITI